MGIYSYSAMGLPITPIGFLRADIGPVWDRDASRMSEKREKNPAERLATNARPPAAHNAKRSKKNYASQNRKSGLRAAYAYKRRAFLTHRPKQGLNSNDGQLRRVSLATGLHTPYIQKYQP